MKKPSTRKVAFAKTVTTSLLVLLAAAHAALAQEKPDQVSPERARANFGRPVVLAADDVRTFPEAPAGFNKPPTNGIAGRTEVFEYDSTVTGARRKAVVYLPPHYSATQKYPVLYLLHGIGGNEWEWSAYVHADAIIDNLIADGKATPMVVVMPNGRALADDRVPASDKIYSPENSGGFAKFERDLLDCLIPAIQAKYSASTNREQRALAGLSMGGGQSLNFGLTHLETFAWVGGFSSAPNTKPPAELVPDTAAASKQLKLLYLSCGNKDGLISISQGVHVYLKGHNVPHIWNVDGHGHNADTWGSNLYHFAQRLFAHGQTSASAANQNPISIPYATEQVINEGDSPAVIAEKAAKVLPRANQTEWMRLERTFFLHFGVNTFNEVEWGSGREEPSIFNPTELDANQWLGAVTNFGGKMIVLVCKHHDGFCYWPTRYTPHSVAASPWRDGKGDEVREVAEAAKTHGVKLAVYLSPADLYQLRTNPKNPTGYYGNGSSNVLSVIPTDPASFKSNPANGRAPTSGFTNFTYVVDDYNRYFLNQLYELLTEYGTIGEVWFDGANPDPSVHETCDYNAWFDLIQKLQPGAIIFGKGPDGRWVGNEGGVGRTTEWSVIPLPTSPEKFTWPDMTGGDLGSRAKLAPGSHLWWYPTEVNTTMLQNSAWFWARNKQPRTVTQLVDIFYTSVGRNGNLILNLSPDKRGLVPDNQLDALNRTAQIIKETFATDRAAGGKLIADNSNATNGAALALDGNLDTWWEAAPGQTNGTVTLALPKFVTFDVVSLQEAVDHRGQRIESFVIETWNGSAWIAAEKVSSDDLTTVGHRRLIRLKTPITTDQVRIRITGSRLEPTLAEIGFFKQSVTMLPPTISDRSTNGAVSLSNLAGNKMVYTVDGSAPMTSSPIYISPIALPMDRSVTVRAASLLPDGELGIAGSRIFAGLMPIGWKVVSVDSEETTGGNNAAANAIDGDSSTIWHTRWNADQKQPHTITVDMGKPHRIGGFTYLPRQDGLLNGVVEKYRFETSADNVTWTTNIAAGSFANIQNNPSLQEVSFTPANARYFRFTSLQAIWNSGWTSAAEISVLPASANGE